MNYAKGVDFILLTRPAGVCQANPEKMTENTAGTDYACVVLSNLIM
jgi:hypothetical protein